MVEKIYQYEYAAVLKPFMDLMIGHRKRAQEEGNQIKASMLKNVMCRFDIEHIIKICMLI